MSSSEKKKLVGSKKLVQSQIGPMRSANEKKLSDKAEKGYFFKKCQFLAFNFISASSSVVSSCNFAGPVATSGLAKKCFFLEKKTFKTKKNV